MKIFHLEADWYGEAMTSYSFLHPDENKTELQFKEDVKAILELYAEEVFNPKVFKDGSKHKRFIGTPEFVEVVASHMNELGYKFPENIYYPFWGSNILKPLGEPEDISDDGNEMDRGFIELLGPEISKRVFDNNEEIELKLCSKDNTI